MTTDVFEEWKKRRFIVASADLLDSADEKVVVLSDFYYWAEYEDEVDAWCAAHGAVRQGMIVTFPDEQILALFCLRWS